MVSEDVGTLLRHVRGLAGEEQPDGQLLRRFAEGGDGEAFGLLMRRHGPLVLAVCRRTLGHATDAEDAFQATFLVLARRAGHLGRGGSVAGWLHTVAYNLALRARAADARRRERERHAAREEAQAGPAWDDVRPVLDEELARLPDKYRLPLILCYLEGRTQDEAAALLGWTKGTVSGRLARAREILRERLARRGLDPNEPLPSAPPVPTALLVTTLAASLGHTAAPAAAASLAAEALRQAALARSASVVAVLTLTVAVGSCLALAGLASAPPTTPPGKADVKPAPADALGDPLPPRASARLGTLRLTQPGGARSAVFSPDGKLLASSGHGTGYPDDEAIRIWDVATGKERCRLEGVSHYMAFSPDARSLAVSEERGRLTLWDVRAARQVWRWDVSSEKASHKFAGVAFAPDGKSVAVAVADGTVRLRSAADGKEIRSIKESASRLTFAPDGKTLASVAGKTVSLWEPATGKLRYTLPHTETVWKATFSPDSRSLAAHGDGNLVALWDVPSGKPIQTVNAPGIGYHMRFTADGKKVRTAHWSLDLITGAQARHFEGAGGGDIALSDGARLWATDNYGALRIRDTATERDLVTLDRHLGPIQYAIPSADGKTVRTVGRHDMTVREWDALSGRHRKVADVGPLRQLGGLSADGRLMVLASPLREFTLYDLATGDVADGGEPNANAQAVTLSADGRLVGASSGDKKPVVRLYDAKAGKLLHTFEGRYSALAFSPDGKTLVGASDLGNLALWDVAAGKARPGPRWQPRKRERPADGAIRPQGGRDLGTLIDADASSSPAAGVAFSPDGKTLAVMSGYHRVRWQAFDSPDAGLIRFYDAATGKELFQLAGQEPLLAFSPDGKTLATGGHGDHAVHLWDAGTGKGRGRLNGHQGRITSLAFTADGRRLISGSEDGTALVWDVGG